MFTESKRLIFTLTDYSLFGRVLQGYIADRIGRFNMVIIATAASGILVLTVWLLSTNAVHLFVFAGLYGLFASAFTSLAPALVGQISIISQNGTRIGIQSAVISLAVLLGNPVGGQLIELYHKSFVGLQVFTGAAMLMSTCAFLFAKCKLGHGILSRA
jgi:MFS family permease